ncbi:gamma-glutamylcyclotransferase [Streptomyces sp. MST-110588]|nr:gamma-glutamylcyclotransferase [Streptomyces sp. MST-110588]
MATESQRLPFFVYGTLRPGGIHYAWALRGRTASEEPAQVGGALLFDGPGYPYAVAGPAGAVVHGDLVLPRAADHDEVRAVLDRLEGYVPGARQNVYERVAVTAVRADGGTVRAWMYLAGEPLATRLRAGGTLIPGGDWLRRPAGPVPATVGDLSVKSESAASASAMPESVRPKTVTPPQTEASTTEQV